MFPHRVLANAKVSRSLLAAHGLQHTIEDVEFSVGEVQSLSRQGHSLFDDLGSPPAISNTPSCMPGMNAKWDKSQVELTRMIVHV